MQKGMLLVISGPSGAGKGTLAEMLLARDASFAFSVSATTRAPRPGEVDGVHYHFITEDAFAEMEASGQFLETARVHGHRYGTPIKPVMASIDAGRNLLLDIDSQGALQVLGKLANCVTVFILPPSYDELERRLLKRGTEPPGDVLQRLINARREIAMLEKYRYALINDELEAAYARLEAIVRAEKLNTLRFKPEID